MGKSNMIKRADGSYSQRGLWDNIRANKGSGKKPTKQMLEQEAKIKAKSKYANGGKVDDFNYDRWRRSLPENLQQESPNYNLRGYWESLNKPDLFNPFEHDLNEDGAYHASSRDPRTGEILKGKLHPTLNLALKDVDDQGNVYTPYMKNRKIYTHTYDSQGNEQYRNGGKTGNSNGIKYPSTVNPKDQTTTNYAGTFQRGYNPSVTKEQYEVDPKTGKPTGRGALEDATLDAMAALDLPLALGKGIGKAFVKNVLKNKTPYSNAILTDLTQLAKKNTYTLPAKTASNLPTLSEAAAKTARIQKNIPKNKAGQAIKNLAPAEDKAISNLQGDLIRREYGKDMYFEPGKMYDLSKGTGRKSTHFTSSGQPVQSHNFGTWDEAGTSFVVPFQEAVELNGIPRSLASNDTYFYNPRQFQYPKGTKAFTSDYGLAANMRNNGFDVTFSKEGWKLQRAIKQAKEAVKNKTGAINLQKPDIENLLKQNKALHDEWIKSNNPKPIDRFNKDINLGLLEHEGGNDILDYTDIRSARSNHSTPYIHSATPEYSAYHALGRDARMLPFNQLDNAGVMYPGRQQVPASLSYNDKVLLQKKVHGTTPENLQKFLDNAKEVESWAASGNLEKSRLLPDQDRQLLKNMVEEKLKTGKGVIKYADGGELNKDIDMKYGKGGSIHIKPENKGKFTSWAKSHGMGVQEAASHVMANKDKYSSTVVKRANFAKNASKWKHALGGMAKYPGGGETEGGLLPGNNFTNIPVTDKFYNQSLANQTAEIANYASANPNVKAGTFSVNKNMPNPVTKPNVNPLGYDNQGFTPSVDTSSLPTQYNKKDWGQQYVPNAKSNYYTYYPTGQTYTPDQYNTYKNSMQPSTAALPTNAMGGYVPKYSYVNGKFIPTHGFGDTTVGAGIKEGGAIAPTLGLAGAFVGDNNSPLGQALDYGAQGASAGMMFGPWGAAIGGGLGLAGGAIKGYMDQEEQAKKQREYDQQKKNANTYAQLMGKGPQSNLSVKTNNQALYAAGGMKVISRNHPNPQEEVEGGETAITPNGRNIQFRGPKHNNGGIKTNLPAGTRIFSDRIVYPG